MTRKAYPLFLLILLAVFPAAAPAAEEVPWPRQAEIAYRVALDYWDVPAPTMCGAVKKFAVSGPSPELINEQSRSVSSEPQTWQPECLIAVAAELPFEVLCPSVVHSVGHMNGVGHSGDPASPMISPGWAPRLVLCSDEQLRLEGFGAIARERIDRAQARCTELAARNAKKRRILRCRRVERSVRTRLQKYLVDPYIAGL